MPEEAKQEELMKDIAKGNFTLRILYDQLANIQKMGPMGQVMSMIPGLSNSGLASGVRPLAAAFSCASAGWSCSVSCHQLQSEPRLILPGAACSVCCCCCSIGMLAPT